VVLVETDLSKSKSASADNENFCTTGLGAGLGAGAGFDAFIAARTVGSSGRVIGVDMTSEMVSKARANAKKGGYTNVDFRLGEIEALPVADASVDVIISNCVINLCPDKRPVYQEAFRTLRPGGHSNPMKLFLISSTYLAGIAHISE